jgi:hypothetical protein
MFAFNREISSNFCQEYPRMRVAIVFSFIFVAGCAARASNVYHYYVKRGSDLEKELGYTLSVQDANDENRSEGMDAVIPIEGPASEYSVKFRATVGGKLKNLIGLDLTLDDTNGKLVRVPLAIRTVWNKENEIDVRFPIKKELINQAVLTIKCGSWIKSMLAPHPETMYAIRLGDYAPANASPSHSPTPRSTLIPGPYHVIRLATDAATGEQVAILDFKVFKSVEALNEHIAKMPVKGEIYFQRWLGPTGGPGWNNKFIKATDELKKFCAEHYSTLTLSAVEPYY